jgi:hypothetical protein
MDVVNNDRRIAAPVLRLSPGRRLAMVIMGFIPLLHVIGVALTIALPIADWTPSWVIGLAPFVLYIVPPLIVRAALSWRPLADGRYGLHSPEFLWWWFSGQCQIVFNRLPLLEELLRLAPGAYSAWLRLWGARVGSLVYWSPGVVIVDRPLIDVGNRAVLGIGVRVCPHLLLRGEHDEAALLLGHVRIGDESLIGGFAVLLPGVHVHDGEELRGARVAPPFAEYQSGRCIRHKQWLRIDEREVPLASDENPSTLSV